MKTDLSGISSLRSDIPTPPAAETMIGINLAAQASSRFPSPGWPLHQVANVRSTLWLLYPAHYESLLSSGWIQKASRLCDRLPGAERSGFEPEIRFCRIHAFQACLLSHSSISPVCIKVRYGMECKGNKISGIHRISSEIRQICQRIRSNHILSISLRISFSLIDCRLSYSFFPRARAISSFA